MFAGTVKEKTFPSDAERLCQMVGPIVGDTAPRILDEIYSSPPEIVSTYDWMKSWGFLDETPEALSLVNMHVQQRGYAIERRLSTKCSFDVIRLRPAFDLRSHLGAVVRFNVLPSSEAVVSGAPEECPVRNGSESVCSVLLKNPACRPRGPARRSLLPEVCFPRRVLRASALRDPSRGTNRPTRSCDRFVAPTMAY